MVRNRETKNDRASPQPRKERRMDLLGRAGKCHPYKELSAWPGHRGKGQLRHVCGKNGVLRREEKLQGGVKERRSGRSNAHDKNGYVRGLYESPCLSRKMLFTLLPYPRSRE